MCSTDYEVASVYYETNRKARKEYKCYECQRIINIKEVYKNTFGVWENKATTFKTCSNCLIPQEWLRKECGGFLHGYLQDEILEHAYEYKRIFLFRWAIGIKNKWQSHRGQ